MYRTVWLEFCVKLLMQIMYNGALRYDLLVPK